MKRLFCFIFSIFFLLNALSVFASDTANLTPGTSRADLLRISTGIQSASITSSSYTYIIPTNSAQPFFKVWIDNTSSYPIVVAIHKNSATGSIVTIDGNNSYTLAANSSVTIRSNTGVVATYYVTLTCATGSMSGTISGRIATTYDELG